MNGTSEIVDFIQGFVHLTDEDIDKVSQSFSRRFIKKKELIVDQGQVCRELGFLVSGVYRAYTLHDGKAVTRYFNYIQRNRLVASFISLLTEKPSDTIVECIEEGELLVVRYAEWLKLYDEIPALNTFGRMMAEYNYLLAMKRIASLQNQSASERYESFLKLYPGLINQIPHHYIASYLGVTPESLSRIRKG